MTRDMGVASDEARAATPDGAEPVPVSGVAGIANALETALAALEEIADWEPEEFTFPEDWQQQIAECEECQRYSGHPIQRGICDTHRRPLWARESHDEHQDVVRGLFASRRASDALYAIRRAQGTSAGTAKTEGLGAKPAGPVGNADAPND